MNGRYSLEEQEQLASFKAFWNKYGNFILTILIIVFGSFAANNGWKWWQARSQTEAVVVFEKLQEALQKSDLELVKSVQGTLVSKHGSSAYAQRGALMVAKAYLNAGKVDEAKAEVSWAVEHAKTAEHEGAARLMLSALLIDQGDNKAALAALNAKVEGFEGLFEDRRGDIALAEKDIDGARKHYEQAVTQLDESPWKQVVNRKLAALPKAGS